MSILSRLLKRGPEDGNPAGGEPAAPAAKERKTPSSTPTQAQAAQPPPAPAPAASAPEPKPEAKPEPKAEAKPEAKSEPKPETKPEAKPAAANGTANGARSSSGIARPAAVTLPGMAPVPATPKAAPPATPPVRLPGMTADPAKGKRAPAPDLALSAASVEQAIEKALSARGPGSAPAGEGTSTPSDRAAMLATFEDLSVAHTASVRSLMMEVRWGEAQTSWIELARPSLRSLRSMAGQIGNGPLTAALDGFDAALEKALAPGAPPAVSSSTREALLAAYGPLAACLPRAFELEGERDRREPLVVRALLEQVPGLDALMIERMVAAGLGRLEELVRAKPDEVAVVANIAADVAAAAVARVQSFKRATQAALATLDPAATSRELQALVHALQKDHTAFEDASRGWSEAGAAAKRQLRWQRQVGFLQIVIALARLGEIDLALRLEKLPFAKRIEELERLISRSMPGLPPTMSTRTEAQAQPGATAAP